MYDLICTGKPEVKVREEDYKIIVNLRIYPFIRICEKCNKIIHDYFVHYKEEDTCEYVYCPYCQREYIRYYNWME